MPRAKSLKSNVETHIRTHTKSKTNNCPDCDFTTVDPGSLTRHRKRIHGYIPKTRRSRHPKPTTSISSDDGSSRISSNQNDGGEAPIPMTTKRISRARMEEAEATEAAEKARAIEILSGLRHSIEEGNFDTSDTDAVSTASVQKVRERGLSTNEAMCQPADWDGIKGEDGKRGAIPAPGSGS
ncbi:hypothetical protein F5876DRAFT_67412 [Lentinula aff. lateritia]|uniref:Uncharacterized protein n=1 Tax=Lentinula aff. lateritia TaxID=2804960 RepID=A0ACC1TU49_9AGAR|nr:hypothetical protein F5876DRAFT_67412 [Lentinula aff. lateritia]